MSQPPQGDRPGPWPAHGPQQPHPPQPAARRGRTGLFVLVGVGALALVVTAVAVAVNVGGDEDAADGAAAGAGGNGSAPATGTASDAVGGYLRAVAEGDVPGALAFAADPAAVDTTSLTPEVMAASAELAPLTAVSVTPVDDPGATVVPVTYRLGSTDVSTAYEVVRASDQSWKLVSVATDVDLSAVKEDSVPMLVNGATLERSSLSLLPGAYRFTSGQRNVDYGPDPTLLVRFPADVPDTTQVEPRISSRGRSSAVSALRKSWERCLDQRSQKPKGCPNRFSYRDVAFRDGTVRWTRRGSDPFRGIEPTYADATSLQYTVRRNLAIKGSCTSGGRSGSCTGRLTGTVQAEARLSGDKVSVEWLP